MTNEEKTGDKITITKGDLATVFATWEAEAKAGNWTEDPENPERHNVCADYMFEKLSKLRETA